MFSSKIRSIINRNELKKYHKAQDKLIIVDSQENALNIIKGILMEGDILISEPIRYSIFKVTDWVARSSRVIQNSRWGHTGLYDGCGTIIEAKVDVLFGPGKMFDGVDTRTLEQFLEDTNFLIARPIVKDEVKHIAVNRMYELLKEHDIKYDKLRFIQGGLDTLGIRTMRARDFQKSRTIICSEAIAEAYWGELEFITGKHYSQILPIHILNSSMVEHIAVIERDKKDMINIRIIDNSYKVNHHRI